MTPQDTIVTQPTALAVNPAQRICRTVTEGESGEYLSPFKATKYVLKNNTSLEIFALLRCHAE
jgi:hypothetical protein